jgi:hypothetical protein
MNFFEVIGILTVVTLGLVGVIALCKYSPVGNTKRLTFDVSRDLVLKLEDLALLSGSRDEYEVVRNALAVYEFLLYHRVGDNRVCITDKYGNILKDVVLEPQEEQPSE